MIPVRSRPKGRAALNNEPPLPGRKTPSSHTPPGMGIQEVERLPGDGLSCVRWNAWDIRLWCGTQMMTVSSQVFQTASGAMSEIDPTDVDCIYWDPRQEYKNEGEAYALATRFFPDNANLKDPFWNNSARGLLAVLSALHQPTISDLALWCANDEEIDRRVVGTEYERILTSNAPGMRSSIIAHLNLIAQPLRMMPQHPEGRPVFSVREYCNHRRGWVFIGGGRELPPDHESAARVLPGLLHPAPGSDGPSGRSTNRSHDL